MTMDNSGFHVTINPRTIVSIKEFQNASGSCQNNRKEVFFIRYIGVQEERAYLEEIKSMDDWFWDNGHMHQSGYIRLGRLENHLAPEQVSRYSELYDEWNGVIHADTEIQLHCKFPFRFEYNPLELTMKQTFTEILGLYQSSQKACSPSILKNFGVKLLQWIEKYLPPLFITNGEQKSKPKLVYYGDIKTQEYLFLYFLVKLGCDVLYLNPERDAKVEPEALLKLSQVTKETTLKPVSIPEPMREPVLKSQPAVSNGMIRVDVSHPKREAKRNQARQNGISTPISGGQTVISFPNLGGNTGTRNTNQNRLVDIPRSAAGIQNTASSNQPMEYEELAKLSSSIVMIGVYDNNKECFKSGSGVLINRTGFILTNFHVVREGAYFGVRLEEEEKIYYTSELVKYNQINDLAVLKIDLNCRSIPIYQGKKDLVRGQKVVAIGSPLGLFNSISDGIISGFRKLDEVSMIQFTAPTSHGSSGGALLDLYGNLIGIITAGFDDGQNLNLAVDYKTVYTFVRGFIGL